MNGFYEKKAKKCLPNEWKFCIMDENEREKCLVLKDSKHRIPILT